jgi:hypothetical protein
MQLKKTFQLYRTRNIFSHLPDDLGVELWCFFIISEFPTALERIGEAGR